MKNLKESLRIRIEESLGKSLGKSLGERLKGSLRESSKKSLEIGFREILRDFEFIECTFSLGKGSLKKKKN